MPRAITRRRFLSGGVALTATLGLARRARSLRGTEGGELILGAMKTMVVATHELSFALVAIDQQGKHWRTVPLAFHFHGLAANPKQPGRAVLFEKHGPGCCEVNLPSGKVIQTIATGSDQSFYGHGAYSPDGRQLYATETRKDGTGLISIRDGRSFSLLGEFPTYGARPHDCRLIDGGATLVVTNGGGKLDDEEPAPSVTYIDVRSTKLRERLSFSNPRINAGHLAIGPRGELAVVSAPRRGLPDGSPGGFTMRAGDKQFLTVTEPASVVKKMVGEVLSLSIHGPSAVVGVTCPDGNLVTFWDLRQHRLVKSFDVEFPRGITLSGDQRHFIVSCGKEPRLDYYKTATLELDAGKSIAEAGLSGSHIYTYRA